MAKRSRLRVHKGNRGRRVLLCIFLLGLFFTVGYSLNKKYEIIDLLQDITSRGLGPLSPSVIERGSLYDRNLKQLAVTMERVAVFVRTREVESISDTALSLASALELDRNTLIDQLESGVLRFWVAEDISEEQEREIKQLNLPGVHFQKEEKRYYPNGSKAAHLLGYVEGGIGLSGVEYYYDRLLATRKLLQEKERQPISSAQELVLTIDLKIQNILESLVTAISQQAGGVRVAAYLVESRSGEIIGGAQYPSFDPNRFARYERKAMQNMFFEHFFLPDKFRLFLKDCGNLYGQQGVDGRQLPWWSREPVSTMGKQLQLWENLHLGEGLGTDFYVNEISGASDSQMGKQTRLQNTAPDFGFIPEVSTPMGILSAFSELLYGPFEKPPFLVKKILDIETGREVELFTEHGESSLEDSVTGPLPEIYQLYLSQAVMKESGAVYFRGDTAVSTPASSSFNQSYINDFTLASIPAGDNPLSLLAVVQRYPVSPGFIGDGKLAVEEILDDRIARISNLHQVAGIVADVVEFEETGNANFQFLEENVTKKVRAQLQVSEDSKNFATMPDMTGLSLRKSLRMLSGIAIEIKIEGTGRVVRQHPSPGTPFKKISSCTLFLEKSENMRPEKMSQKALK